MEIEHRPVLRLDVRAMPHDFATVSRTRGTLLWLVLLLDHLAAHDRPAYAALLAGPVGNGLRELARRHSINPPADISEISLCALGILQQEVARAVRIASDAADLAARR
jgi:hypothetical protein